MDLRRLRQLSCRRRRTITERSHSWFVTRCSLAVPLLTPHASRSGSAESDLLQLTERAKSAPIQSPQRMHPWRERLQRWFEPLARRCPFSPNAVTLFALLLNALAAAFLYLGSRNPWHFVTGTVILIVAGLADAFDGIVARVQNKSTLFGDFLDHSADRLSDSMLITGWMLGSGVRVEIAVATIVAVGLNGYLGTQLEATWKERRYDALGRGEFVLALVVFPVVSFILGYNGWRHVAAGGLTVAEWLTMALFLFALLGIAQRLVMAWRMERS